MQRPECKKSKAHSRQKKFSGRSLCDKVTLNFFKVTLYPVTRALSLKDVKHGFSMIKFFALEEAPWSTMDIGLKCSLTKGREVIQEALQ